MPKDSQSKQADSQSEGSNAAGNMHSTRLNQKSILNEDLEEIQNSTEAPHYLEKTQLIVPPGQVPTLGLLATAIHHVSSYKPMPRPAINTLQAIAFLMEELEETALNQTVQDLVTFQLDVLGTDLKDFVTDATCRIDEHLENKMAEISTATKTLMDTVKDTITSLPPLGTSNMTQAFPPLDYQQALMKPPSHMDPRLTAKEGIKLCQFLLNSITRESGIGKMSVAKMKKAVNRAIEKVGSKEIKVRSTI